MKKVAIPMLEDQLCPHFGRAQSFIIYTLENKNITEKKDLLAPTHEPGVYPDWIINQKITDVIAQGIGRKAFEILDRNGTKIHTGVKVNDPELIIQQFLDGTLETNMNLCDH
jgi:predicted Fe-Mo cluster-binding NifX family protein